MSLIVPILRRPTFWAPQPTKPSAQEISGMTTRDIYKAGRECYRQGGVVSAMIRRNLAFATVEDGGATYRVVAPLEYFVPYCPCMDCEQRRACRHGVAALLYVSKMFKHLIQDDPWEDVKNTLASMPEDILGAFAADVLAAADPPETRTDSSGGGEAPRRAVYRRDAPAAVDKDVRATVAELLKSDKTRDLFAARFGEPDLPDHTECRDEISYMFREAESMIGDAPHVRLADFFKAAKARERRGDVDEAILTYREITEGVMIDGMNADDEDGFYSSAFNRALDAMAICIKRHLRNPAQRRPHIRYLHRRFIDVDYYWFDDEYKGALFKICPHIEDLKYLTELHDAHMEEDTSPSPNDLSYYPKRMQEMRDELLSRLGG